MHTQVRKIIPTISTTSSESDSSWSLASEYLMVYSSCKNLGPAGIINLTEWQLGGWNSCTIESSSEKLSRLQGRRSGMSKIGRRSRGFTVPKSRWGTLSLKCITSTSSRNLSGWKTASFSSKNASYAWKKSKMTPHAGYSVVFTFSIRSALRTGCTRTPHVLSVRKLFGRKPIPRSSLKTTWRTVLQWTTRISFQIT